LACFLRTAAAPHFLNFVAYSVLLLLLFIRCDVLLFFVDFDILEYFAHLLNFYFFGFLFFIIDSAARTQTHKGIGTETHARERERARETTHTDTQILKSSLFRLVSLLSILMLMLLLLVPLVFWQKGVKAFKPKTKTGN